MASHIATDAFVRTGHNDPGDEGAGARTPNLLITNRILETLDRALGRKCAVLAFPPELEARFEADMRDQRVRHLRRMIVFGFVIFHLYGLSNVLTAPDVAMMDLCLRMGMATPIGLGILWLIGRVTGRTREALCGLGMLAVASAAILAVALGHDPVVPLSAPGIGLVVIFGNNLLILRFPWACLLGAVTVTACVAIVSLGDEAITAASVVTELDILAAVSISLVAAHQIEAAQRRGYLITLRETLRSQRLAAENTALARLSSTDPLTGLANRRAFTERLERLWAETRTGQPFALLLVDVDHFKRFNDLYGHGAGDACLREVADLLRAHAARSDDLVARYGGEEFAFLLPRLDRASALALAERIRIALEARRLPHAGRGDGLNHLTVSAGVATSADGAPSPVALVDAADAALYQAKSAGRNRVGPIPTIPEREAGPTTPSSGLAAWPALWTGQPGEIGRRLRSA